MNKTLKQALDDKLEKEYGALTDYWYPLARIKLIKTNKPHRVFAFNTHFIIWKNTQGAFSVFLDMCPHRMVPLSKGSINKSIIQCAYHGWEFDHDGVCQNIPVDPESQSQKIRCLNIPSQIKLGILWFYPGNHSLDNFNKDPIIHTIESNHYCLYEQEIHCDVDDLIENFMDSPHTNFVHNGLIRKQKSAEARTIQIISHDKGISIQHQASFEKVGPFSKAINPENNPVSHSDDFILPANVKVSYSFSQQSVDFITQIYLCPIDASNTRAFIHISCQFPKLNALIIMGIKLLAPIILYQDKQILRSLTENKSKLPDFSGLSSAYDSASLKIRKIRKEIKNRSFKSIEPDTKTMTVHL